MRKLTVTLIAIISFAVAKAQDPASFTLNVYGGYTFMDRVRLGNYFADVQEGFEWGGGLEYFIHRNEAIEFKYKRMATRFPLYLRNGEQQNPGRDNGTIQFFTVGGNHYFAENRGQKAIPYIGGAIGVGVLTGMKNSSTNFAWDVQAGVKIKTSKMVSLKLNAYVQSITHTFGTEIWFVPGWGPVPVSNFATLFQFGLGGAVCFDFKKK